MASAWRFLSRQCLWLFLCLHVLCIIHSECPGFCCRHNQCTLIALVLAWITFHEIWPLWRWPVYDFARSDFSLACLCAMLYTLTALMCVLVRCFIQCECSWVCLCNVSCTLTTLVFAKIIFLALSLLWRLHLNCFIHSDCSGIWHFFTKWCTVIALMLAFVICRALWLC